MEFDPHSLEPFWDTWYIDSFIGEGSYGYVYRIYREDYGIRTYSALKIISIPKTAAEAKQLTYDGMDENTATLYYQDMVEVIYREIELMAKLKGKTNIVSYEDHKIIQKQKGIGFYLLIRMELLECLNDYLLHTPFTDEDAVKLGKDLCEALILCQKRNIIHRDIKPGNIFVTTDGDYKLGDFGIARQLEGTKNGLSIKGTFEYMAPEVNQGKMYDGRADIYSLGLVLYFFLNNRKEPFGNPTSSVQRFSDHQENMFKRFSGEKLPRPALASEKLADIILKACEYDPNDRFQSPEAFLGALNSLSEADLLKNIINPNSQSGEKVPIEIINPPSSGTIPIGPNTNRRTGGKAPEILPEPKVSGPVPVPVAAPVSITAGIGSGESEKPKGRLNPVKLLVSSFAFIVVIAVIVLIIFLSKKNNNNADFVSSDAEVTPVTQVVPSVSPMDGKPDTEDAAASLTPEVTAQTIPYELELDGKDLTNYSNITNIHMLTSLSISDNQLSSVEELQNSQYLWYLNIQNNRIGDIAALSGLSSLTCLNAADNLITDPGPLGKLTSLGILILSNNKISSIDELADLTSLTTLQLDGNTGLKDISALSKMQNLQVLTLANTGVTDISPILDLTALSIVDLTGLSIPQEQLALLKQKLPDASITY